MRLIDELTLQRELFSRIQRNAIDSGSVHYDSYKNWCLSGSEVEKAISDIFSQVEPFCPTIDPEILPIVQELRKELERVTAERNALLKEFAGECGLCLYYKDCIKNHHWCHGSDWEWRGIQEVQEDE